MTTASNDLGRRGFVLRPLHMIGIAIIVLAIVLGYYGLQSGLRPYTTSVSEANSTGKVVQVLYGKPKPANFEKAISIVAIGHYDAAKGAFMADDMLVKCPSKYQEQLDQTQ